MKVLLFLSVMFYACATVLCNHFFRKANKRYLVSHLLEASQPVLSGAFVMDRPPMGGLLLKSSGKRDRYEARVNNSFQFWRLLQLFPYQAKDGSFRSSLVALVPFYILSGGIFVFLLFIIIFGVQLQNVSFLLLYLCPSFTCAFALVVHALSLTFAKRTLDVYLSSLREAERNSGSLDPTESFIIPKVLFYPLATLASWPPFVSAFPECLPWQLSLFTLTHTSVFLAVSVLDQFSAGINLLSFSFAVLPLGSTSGCDALRSAARSFASVFAPQIFIALSGLFINTLIRTFQMLRGPRNDIPCHIASLVLEVWPIWRVVSACEYLSKLSDEFDNDLYRLLINKNFWTNVDKKLHFHLKVQDKLSFSVCGMFNLSFPLFHSMVATCATYLIVLVQFSDDGQALWVDSSHSDK